MQQIVVSLLLPQMLKRKYYYQTSRCVLTIKKDGNNSEILPLNDYVQVYEPALSHNDIMAIAEEFVRTHLKEIIIFGSTQTATKELAKKFESKHDAVH